MFELTLTTLVLFVFQGGLVFVCGTADGIIKVSGRRHNCDDLKATILAVDPIKFVYRGRLDINRESVNSKSSIKPPYSPSVISPSPSLFFSWIQLNLSAEEGRLALNWESVP